MKLRVYTTVAAAAALALSLSACASVGAVTGPSATKGAIKARSDAELQLLKEANRHLELCDRTYGWPFTAVITCHATAPAPTAAEIAAMIEAAVTKALASHTQ